MKKISEFLQDLGAHELYDSHKLAISFKEETGQEAIWSSYSTAQATRMAGGPGIKLLPGTEDMAVVAGYNVAEKYVEKFAKHAMSYRLLCNLSGRGSRFRTAILCLEEVGL